MNERDASDSRASRRFLITLFVVALALRIAAVLALDTPAAARGSSAWAWGHEPACLAQALVEGRGYADPWGKGSGASSWLTPPYPLLLALLFKLFGGVTYAGAWTLHALQALASALTCVLLIPLGRSFGSPRAGKLAGWLFALYPVAISNAAQVVWDTTFVALALTAFLLLFLRAPATRRGAIVSGLAYGGLLFLNPAPMSLAPVLLFFAWRRAGANAKALAHVALFAIAAFAVCMPWMLRNQAVLGSFSLRPNYAVEVRIGNHDEANGRPVPFRYHPSHVASELALYRELGEAEYARENMTRARAWIEAHPARFVQLTAKRIAMFWVGELPTSDARRSAGLAPQRDPASWIKFFAYALVFVAALAASVLAPIPRELRWFSVAALALFGVPYYFSHVSERYRFPIDPWLVVLGALLVTRLFDRVRRADASPNTPDG